MTDYAFGNFEFGIDLANLINEACQVHAYTGNFAHLGITEDDQNQRLAEIVNRAVLAFMRACPGIGLSFRSTITTVANQQGYAIPSDLQGMAVGFVQWANTGLDPVNDSRFLRYLNQGAVVNLPTTVANGNITVPKPTAFSISNFAANVTTLTGTVNVTNGSASIEGNDTEFTSELEAGDVIQIYGQNLTVGTVTDDDEIICTSPWTLADFDDMAIQLLEGEAFSQINLWPYPSQAGNVANVIYQTAPTPVTADNIANRTTSPTMITEIPTEYQNVVAMNVAINILTQDNMLPRKEFLMSAYPQILKDAQMRVGAPEAADNALASAPGSPSNIVPDQPLFGGMFNFGISGAYWQ